MYFLHPSRARSSSVKSVLMILFMAVAFCLPSRSMAGKERIRLEAVDIKAEISLPQVGILISPPDFHTTMPENEQHRALIEAWKKSLAERNSALAAGAAYQKFLHTFKNGDDATTNTDSVTPVSSRTLRAFTGESAQLRKVIRPIRTAQTLRKIQKVDLAERNELWEKIHSDFRDRFDTFIDKIDRKKRLIRSRIIETLTDEAARTPIETLWLADALLKQSEDKYFDDLERGEPRIDKAAYNDLSPELPDEPLLNTNPSMALWKEALQTPGPHLAQALYLLYYYGCTLLNSEPQLDKASCSIYSSWFLELNSSAEQRTSMLFIKGQELFEQRQLTDAQEAFSEGAKLDSGIRASLLYMSGVTAYRLADFKASMRANTLLLSAYPDSTLQKKASEIIGISLYQISGTYGYSLQTVFDGYFSRVSELPTDVTLKIALNTAETAINAADYEEAFKFLQWMRQTYLPTSELKNSELKNALQQIVEKQSQLLLSVNSSSERTAVLQSYEALRSDLSASNENPSSQNPQKKAHLLLELLDEYLAQSMQYSVGSPNFAVRFKQAKDLSAKWREAYASDDRVGTELKERHSALAASLEGLSFADSTELIKVSDKALRSLDFDGALAALIPVVESRRSLNEIAPIASRLVRLFAAEGEWKKAGLLQERLAASAPKDSLGSDARERWMWNAHPYWSHAAPKEHRAFLKRYLAKHKNKSPARTLEAQVALAHNLSTNNAPYREQQNAWALVGTDDALNLTGFLFKVEAEFRNLKPMPSVKKSKRDGAVDEAWNIFNQNSRLITNIKDSFWPSANSSPFKSAYLAAKLDQTKRDQDEKIRNYFERYFSLTYSNEDLLFLALEHLDEFIGPHTDRYSNLACEHVGALGGREIPKNKLTDFEINIIEPVLKKAINDNPECQVFNPGINLQIWNSEFQTLKSAHKSTDDELTLHDYKIQAIELLRSNKPEDHYRASLIVEGLLLEFPEASTHRSTTFLLAQIAFAMGQPHTLNERLGDLTLFGPETQDVNLLLTQINIDNYEYSNAQKTLDFLIQKQGDVSAELHAVNAWLSWQLGHEKDALRHIEKALAANQLDIALGQSGISEVPLLLLRAENQSSKKAAANALAELLAQDRLPAAYKQRLERIKRDIKREERRMRKRRERLRYEREGKLKEQKALEAAEKAQQGEIKEREGKLKEASELYLESCNAGNGRACARIGMLYEQGRGVTADRIKAREYYLQGCDYGHKKACDDALRIEER